ncbi:MAG: selenide, water dikinase SelD [Taibaiella sp.]|nr:selenide, water dikinase SelD [Taibaiella sp.]
MQQTGDEIRLTQYSHGGGCGCKIAPAVLEEILKTNIAQPDNDKLLVGNSSNDDACAYDLGNGTALISTTDFFTPIVDDAYDYGRIAAANAISDVYAMGGRPIVAIAVLGWPVEKLPATLAKKVIEGARTICNEAGIPLAGGHSIDAAEPFFGLSVNGIADIAHLKRNNTAQAGDILFLTKPLGVGVLSTAQKRGLATPGERAAMVAQMAALNKVGEALGKIAGVHAITDVTGFGLLGHLTEMAGGSSLSAEIHYSRLHIAEGVTAYLQQQVRPDATTRNWNAYGGETSFAPGVDVMQAFNLLPDPQTNGGLLVAVAPEAVDEVKQVLIEYGLNNHLEPIGRMVQREEKTVVVKQ